MGQPRRPARAQRRLYATGRPATRLSDRLREGGIQRGDSRTGRLRVLRRRPAARTHGADHLPPHDDGNAALDGERIGRQELDAPAGDDGVELTNTGATAAAFTTIVRVGVTSDPALFVAVTVNVNVPAVVGVPESAPAELNVSPPGNAPELTVNAIGVVPVAVNV